MGIPSIQVIIPTLDPEPGLLSRAVRSALACPGVLGVTVVDDGSAAPVGRADVGEGPVRIVRRRRGGPGAARNAGLEVFDADYALFLDDDDELLPEGLPAALDVGAWNDAVAVVAARFEHMADGRVVRRDAPVEWAGTVLPGPGAVFRPIVLFNGSGILVRREVVEGGVRFHAGLYSGQDREFLRRVAEVGPIAVSPVPLVASHRRARGTHVTSPRFYGRRIRAHVIMLRKYGDAGAAPYMRPLTLWLMNAASKRRIDAGHWALLAREAAAHGWRPPVKARIRRWLALPR